MKRLLTISLFALYINSYTEFHELFRLPLLIQHYEEHKQQVEDLSFWEFLVMHYKTDVAHDDQDHRLPFKDRAHSFTTPALTLPFQKIVLPGINPAKENSTLVAIHRSLYYLALLRNFSTPQKFLVFFIGFIMLDRVTL